MNHYIKNKRKVLINLHTSLFLVATLLSLQQLNGSKLKEYGVAEKKKQTKNHMDCEGFPSWPVTEAAILYDDTVGAPKCHETARNSAHPWVLHQSSVQWIFDL